MRSATVEALFGHAAPTLPADASREVFAERLESLARAIVEHVLTPEYVDLVRLVIAESSRRPHLADNVGGAVPSSGAANVAALLQQARTQGLLRADVDVALAARAFVGPLLTWLLGAGLLDASQSLEAPPAGALRQLVRMFLDGVGGGGAAAPAGVAYAWPSET
jgi:hypothetical protein